MKCYIDIENSKTQKVETLCVNIIKYEEDKEAIFDISTLNSHELEILKDAVYRENENLKSEFIKSKPKKSIFMDLFFDKNYNMIALFKKKSNVNSTNLRDHLEYIDSYCEDENLEEGRHL